MTSRMERRENRKRNAAEALEAFRAQQRSTLDRSARQAHDMAHGTGGRYNRGESGSGTVYSQTAAMRGDKVAAATITTAGGGSQRTLTGDGSAKVVKA